MLLSRHLAKRRIAANLRPSFKQAWGPVAFDIIVIAFVLALVWQPALTFVYVMQLGLAATIGFLFLVIFVPLQVVIILSSLWAVKSRWEDAAGSAKE